jgi:hypothetical protein
MLFYTTLFPDNKHRGDMKRLSFKAEVFEAMSLDIKDHNMLICFTSYILRLVSVHGRQKILSQKIEILLSDCPEMFFLSVLA